MPDNTDKSRRRKRRTPGALLDASWVVGSGDGDSSLPNSTTETPLGSQSASTTSISIAQQDAGESEKSNENDDKEAASDGASGGLQAQPQTREAPPTEAAESQAALRPSTSSDNKSASGESQITSSVRLRPGARKKRYASGHSADWIAAPDETLSKQLPSSASASATNPAVRNDRPQYMPGTGSPSIFRPSHSPNGGYDAPPVGPVIMPTYSPHDRPFGKGH